jgi:hypothetical protein
MLRKNFYVKCSVCRSIISDAEQRFFDGLDPCPECGNKGSVARDLWPKVDMLYVLDSINFPPNIDDAGKLKLVLYCALFDALLEDFLEGFLDKMNTPLDMIEYLIESNSKFLERFNLFKQTAGENLETVFEKGDYGEFIRSIKFLNDEKNRLLNQDQGINFELLTKSFQTTEENLLSAFVFLNNKFLR